MERIVMFDSKADINSISQQVNDLLSNGYHVKDTMSIKNIGVFVLSNNEISTQTYHEPIKSSNPSNQDMTYKQKNFIVKHLKARDFDFEKYNVTLDNVDTLSKSAAGQLIKDIINANKNVDK